MYDCSTMQTPLLSYTKEYRYPYYLSTIITRLDVDPIITSSPLGPITEFSNMQSLDQFGTKMYSVAAGVYELYIICRTTNRSAEVTFSLNFTEIIGHLDFYSAVDNVTVKRIEGIIIPYARKLFIARLLDTRNNNSVGWDLHIGDMILVKLE